MRILWVIHLYPPYHNCGAEMMAHSLNKFLLERGHSVRVLLRQASSNNPNQVYHHEGVMVFPPRTKPDPLYMTSDVIFTHLDYTREAILTAKRFGKKVVHFVHNSSPYGSILEHPEVDIVYNSEWIKEELNYPNRSFVLRPPCDWRVYKVPRGSNITLINLDTNKGGHILREIAKKLPDKKFLAVKGSYSATDDGQITEQPKNVRVIENTPDILSVYKKTRVLLMPSLYESWGRTATEAMCSGIPVVVSATKGLSENCDYAGLYVHDRDDIDQWIRWIKRLDDERFYKFAAEKSLKRSLELDPINNMSEFLQWI